MAFIGRNKELQILNSIYEQKKSALIVVSGRRRIGKSALVHEFSKRFDHFYEFQGLAPRSGMSNASQLKHFAEQTKIYFSGAEPKLSNWNEAFEHLAKELKLRNKPLLFLDEISWMARYDLEFVGKLKVAWDLYFSRIPGLVMILCGSVSAWIEEHILKEKDFVGRISHTLRIKELELKSALNFWGIRSRQLSIIDRLNYLSIVGAIPKYLEEFNIKESLDSNIIRLCYTRGGYLLEDFEKIFSDLFEKKSDLYKQIVRQIINSHLSPSDLAKKLKIKLNGDLSQAIKHLELSGFIARDYVIKPSSKQSKLSKLRISDNYLRFYLKYLEPKIKQINAEIYEYQNLNSLVAWNSISGLQFENLVLNHLSEIVSLLGIDKNGIIAASPYFQNKSTKTAAVQVDLLIEAKHQSYYICEIKFKRRIGMEIIDEVKEKISKIKLPKYSSRRPVLIYAGELDDQVKDTEFFDIILNLAEVF